MKTLGAASTLLGTGVFVFCLFGFNPSGSRLVNPPRQGLIGGGDYKPIYQPRGIEYGTNERAGLAIGAVLIVGGGMLYRQKSN